MHTTRRANVTPKPTDSGTHDVRVALLAAVTCAILMAMVLLMGTTPGYGVGDDYELDLYARGEMYGTPGLLMPYVLLPVSAPLCLLYRMLPSVPWYPLTLLFLIVVSSTVMLTMALRLRNATLRALFAVAALCSEVVLALCLTYTIVAFVTCATGLVIILLHGGLVHPEALRPSDLAAYLLVVVGYSLRPESGLGAAAVFSPFLVWALVHNRNRRTIAMAAGVVACMVACSAVGTIAYRTTPGWESFDEMLSAARSVVDHQPIAFDDAQRVAPQLSRNDLNMMYLFLFVDGDVFDLETFRALSSVVPRLTLDWFVHVGDHWQHALFLLSLMVLLFCLAMLTIGLCGHTGEGWRALTLSVPAMVLVLLLYLTLRNRSNIQSVTPLYMLGIYALLLCATAGTSRTRAQPPRRRAIVAPALAIVAMLVVAVLFASNANIPSGKQAAKMHAYLDGHPEQLVVILNSFGELCHGNDIWAYDSTAAAHNVAQIGSHMQYSAPWQAFLSRYGLDGGRFLIGLLDDANAVGVSPPGEVIHMCTYLSEHTGKLVVAQRMGDFSVGDKQGSRLWRYRTAHPTISEDDVPKLAKQIHHWFCALA